jgi:hypothetical protein
MRASVIGAKGSADSSESDDEDEEESLESLLLSLLLLLLSSCRFFGFAVALPMTGADGPACCCRCTRSSSELSILSLEEDDMTSGVRWLAASFNCS